MPAHRGINHYPLHSSHIEYFNSHICVCADGIRTQMYRPYAGPFRVDKRCPKIFVLGGAGRHDTVSIERIKSATVQSTLNVPPLSSYEFQHPGPVQPLPELLTKNFGG